jgi:hypothetical protein
MSEWHLCLRPDVVPDRLLQQHEPVPDRQRRRRVRERRLGVSELPRWGDVQERRVHRVLADVRHGVLLGPDMQLAFAQRVRLRRLRMPQV